MISLSKEQFSKKFRELHSGLQNEFFKLEVSQTYQEYGIDDWSNVSSREMKKIIKTSQESVYKQKEAFENKIKQGVVFERVRYLTFPLDKYILRQFSSYLIAEEIGENIFILEYNDNIQSLKSVLFKDFLLFDDIHVLVHRYENGIFEGGYFSSEPRDLLHFVELKRALKQEAITYKEFTENYNLRFNNLI